MSDMKRLIITGNLVDCFQQKIYPAELTLAGSRIESIRQISYSEQNTQLPYILPGFIDSHIHIESSMLVPSEFARLAVVHGTVATVSDPHEIANVCGIDGVKFMLDNARQSPFKFNFGAPSCVPATFFETAGATLDAMAVENLLDLPEIKYLSEMMNFPGALQGEPEVIKKIDAAKARNKPVDGHAPGLMGKDAETYISRGITTDHECFTAEEAKDKLKFGMKIIIREGSAAKNFDALIDLLHEHPDKIMFCSDDKHPDSLVEGHINQLCARAAARGIDIYKILKAACINPVLHYKLDVGLLREGDAADFILVRNLDSFEILETWIDGNCVAKEGKTLLPLSKVPDLMINNFHCSKKELTDFRFTIPEDSLSYPYPVIEAWDGQLITGKLNAQPAQENGSWVSDVGNDVLKIVVVNRYFEAPVAKAFIKNFGLKNGALASSVAHDSHNIVAVGTSDAAILEAVNMVIASEGGISCITDNLQMILPLPVAGLMSYEDGYRVAELYTLIDKAAKTAGSTLAAPFMTLSFMALLVIPHLKLSDTGLFDGDSFKLL
jgi:adenine deaminase